jgi:hypothetical protein
MQVVGNAWDRQIDPYHINSILLYHVKSLTMLNGQCVASRRVTSRRVACAC